MNCIFLDGKVLSLPIPHLIVAADEHDFHMLLKADPLACGLFMANTISRGVGVTGAVRAARLPNPIYCLIFGPEADHKMVAAILNAGADQVERFPVAPELFRAQLEAVARRGQGNPSPVVEFGGFVYRPIERELSHNGARIRLSDLESKVLDAIISAQGREMSQVKIHDRIYGFDEGAPEVKIIDVMITKLRKKIMAVSGGVDFIKTMWGFGYAFEPGGFIPKYRKTVTGRHQRIEGQGDARQLLVDSRRAEAAE